MQIWVPVGATISRYFSYLVWFAMYGNRQICSTLSGGHETLSHNAVVHVQHASGAGVGFNAR
jgi:hypothetical protein